MAKRKTSHRDVQFVVNDAQGKEQIFDKWDTAVVFAAEQSLHQGRPVNLDVLVYSIWGAKWLGADDAAERYRQDPKASVFDRYVIAMGYQGSVP